MNATLTEITAKPCVGCGYCCMSAWCAVAESLFEHSDKHQICPALRWGHETQRYWCSIADRYLEELAIGAGCCSGLCNSWRSDIKQRELPAIVSADQYDRQLLLEAMAALLYGQTKEMFINSDKMCLAAYSGIDALVESGWDKDIAKRYMQKIINDMLNRRPDSIARFMG